MGLDISAHSRLRFKTKDVPEDYDYDDGNVVIFGADGFDRLDDLSPGLYMPTTDVHLWWKAEHDTFDIPASEVTKLEERIEALRNGTKPECPGDLVVLAEDRPISDSTGFRAGSYSGYNWWREQLCQLALDVPPNDVWEDPDAFDGKPFVELINYSDAEGCIGPRTSAKLARDFRDHKSRVAEAAEKRITDADERGYFLESYDNWQHAFDLAAHDGFVIFH